MEIHRTTEILINYSFAPTVGLIFLLLVLVKNRTVDQVNRKLFMTAWILELMELIAYDLELYTATWDHLLPQVLATIGAYSVFSQMFFIPMMRTTSLSEGH